MKKETLERAKRLEEDIRQMEFSLSYYKRGRWSHWGINDSADSFHFEFCKNWSHRDADMQNLPTWLTKPLMEVVEREMNRCKQELEALADESVVVQTDFVHTGMYSEEEAEQPTTQEEKHGTICKLFWSFWLGVILLGVSALANVFACEILGGECNMQTIEFNALFGTIWLACYLLLDKKN